MAAHKRLLLSLPDWDDEDEDAPCEFRIFAFGKTNTTKGAYHLDQESAQAVMLAASEYGNRLTIDYEHQALSDPPVQAPAAASFLLELRADGIYAVDVKWTEKAAQMLRAKEYLYFSPAFTADKSGRPMRLLNVALTNIPATKNMQSLVAANISQESRMLTVLSALSLKEDANEAQALKAVTQLSEERRQLLTVTGKDSIAEAIGVITALKAKADQADALQLRLSAIEASSAKAEMVSLIDEATRDGQITPANRPTIEKLADEHGIKALRGYLEVIPKKAAPAVEKLAAPAPVTLKAATEIEKMLKATGVSQEDLVKHGAKVKHVIPANEEA